MVKEFNCKGHHYKVVPIEGSTDYMIIKDGKTPRRIKQEIAMSAIDYVTKLF